mgnify:CR=1 FL=1
MDEQNLEAIMGLIMYGGNAKSDAMEAIAAAKEGNFELADQKIADAEASLVEAHHSQNWFVDTRSTRQPYDSDLVDGSFAKTI